MRRLLGPSTDVAISGVSGVDPGLSYLAPGFRGTPYCHCVDLRSRRSGSGPANWLAHTDDPYLLAMNFSGIAREAWVSIKGQYYRNPNNYVVTIVHYDDGVTAILIIVARQLIGNDPGEGNGVRGIRERCPLFVFDGRTAAHDMEEVSHQVALPIQVRLS
jgi:hypothetical protein